MGIGTETAAAAGGGFGCAAENEAIHRPPPTPRTTADAIEAATSVRGRMIVSSDFRTRNGSWTIRNY
jgi:hypothetical protein